jgi:hypothetical protein
MIYAFWESDLRVLFGGARAINRSRSKECRLYLARCGIFPFFFYLGGCESAAAAGGIPRKKNTREIDLSEISRAANMNGAVRIRGMLADWDKEMPSSSASAGFHALLQSSPRKFILSDAAEQRANSHGAGIRPARCNF